VSGLEDCPRKTVQISSPGSQIKQFICSRYVSQFQTVNGHLIRVQVLNVLTADRSPVGWRAPRSI